MAKEVFRADPYVVTTKHTGGLLGLLQGVFRLPRADYSADPTRWGYYHGDWIDLDNLTLERRSPVVVGTAFRVRMNDLSLIAGPTGAVDAQLAENQGHGRHVAFLLDTERGIFWFQRDITMRPGVFFDYLRDKSGEAIGWDSKLDPDAVQRALSMGRIKEVSVKLWESRGSRPEIEEAPGLNEWWKWRKKFGGAKIEITIKPAHGEFLEGGGKRLVKETTDLADLGVPELHSAYVTGLLPPDPDTHQEKMDTIKLLNDRYLFSIEAHSDRFRRAAPLMRLIRSVWQANRSNVK